MVNQAGQVVASIGPKPSPRSEKIEEEFTNGIVTNMTYVVELAVHHRDFEGEAVHNATSICKYGTTHVAIVFT